MYVYYNSNWFIRKKNDVFTAGIIRVEANINSGLKKNIVSEYASSVVFPGPPEKPTTSRSKNNKQRWRACKIKIVRGFYVHVFGTYAVRR